MFVPQEAEVKSEAVEVSSTPAQFVGETDIDLAVHCLLQDDRAAGRLEGLPP